jgi:hypothetical protein
VGLAVVLGEQVGADVSLGVPQDRVDVVSVVLRAVVLEQEP